jgi:AcrR family transcriptional regulator
VTADFLSLERDDLVAAPAEPGTEAAALPASRHYRRARQDRGAETRQRLLLAALDAFGRYGFEGAATRDIAKRAEANLAAIVYHFGSKEALHRATADYVVAQMAARTSASVERAKQALEGELDRATARRLLQDIIDDSINSMLGQPESELWGRFIMREQMEPSSTFDVIFNFLEVGQMTMTRLVALLLRIDPASEEATHRTMAISGQYVIFRVGQPMLLRRLGRDALSADDHEEIRRVIVQNIDLLVGEPLATAA